MALGFFDSLISILKFVQISVYGTQVKTPVLGKKMVQGAFLDPN